MNQMSLIHYLSNRTSIDDYANKVGYGLAGIVGIVAITLFTMMPIPKIEREEVVKREMTRRRKETHVDRMRRDRKLIKLFQTPGRRRDSMRRSFRERRVNSDFVVVKQRNY